MAISTASISLRASNSRKSSIIPQSLFPYCSSTIFFTAGTQSLEHVKAKRLKLLAVTEAKRSPFLPDVPTVAETVPGYEMTVWYGAFGPPGMPKEIVAKLNGEISRALFLPEVKGRMADIAVEVASSTPEELAARMRNDAEKWGGVIKSIGIVPQ